MKQYLEFIITDIKILVLFLQVQDCVNKNSQQYCNIENRTFYNIVY